MDALRNVSSQSFLLQTPGGGNRHLLPGRAVTLSVEEIKSPQIQQLLKGGFVQIEKLGKLEHKVPAPPEPNVSAASATPEFKVEAAPALSVPTAKDGMQGLKK